MLHFPVFMKFSRRPVLLIGAGDAAAAKASLLLAAGADLRVLPAGDTPVAAMESHVRDRGVTIIDGAIETVDLTDKHACVVSACGDGRDEVVAARMAGSGTPFNAVDRPDLSTFIVPAIVDRGDVVVAVGTGGGAPVLARRLRERIEALLPEGIGRLGAFIAAHRAPIAAWSTAARRRFWERVIDGPIGAAVLAGREGEAAAGVASLRDAQTGEDAVGSVQLVGAGPGDPDLLTVKALRALQDADIVLYDDLVTAPILDRIRRDAEKVFVGKRAGTPGLGQEAIHRLMIDHARSGRAVVRLKGGDPFVFGRGGEEIEALREAGIAFDVVPGITAAVGCAASLELPLTHRRLASRLATVAAHRRADAEAVNWQPLADEDTTVAVYMGRSAAATVANGLIAAGRAPDTPVAVIASGTRPDAVTHVGRLDGLPALAALTAATPSAPVLFIVGDVVSLSRPWIDAAETRFLAVAGE
ncbi:siroheme synthase CysG [Fodinicurvata sp. EGI_FJ10296]|uniref:siroheme synthase CysG n=1 Tax=Fodinicurvata sp. EGI_FJ10296 TaxID=3231908 RepID=UPI0034560551